MKSLITLLASSTLLFSSFSFADVPGKYTITFPTPMGSTASSELVINKDGTGAMDGAMGQIQIQQVDIEDDYFTFDITAKFSVGEMEMTWEGNVEADNITGVIIGPLGSAEFKGARNN